MRHDCQGLARELREEMDIEVSVGAQVMQVLHAYDDYDIDFRVFRCHITRGEVNHKRVYDHRWVASHELDQYEFPPADQKTFEQLLGLRDG